MPIFRGSHRNEKRGQSTVYKIVLEWMKNSSELQIVDQFWFVEEYRDGQRGATGHVSWPRPNQSCQSL